jgi:hypothetical protein
VASYLNVVWAISCDLVAMGIDTVGVCVWGGAWESIETLFLEKISYLFVGERLVDCFLRCFEYLINYGLPMIIIT